MKSEGSIEQPGSETHGIKEEMIWGTLEETQKRMKNRVW